MQKQKTFMQKSLTPLCPRCGTETQGFSVNFHHYQCPQCNVGFNTVKAAATQGFEWVVAGACLLLIIGAIAELCS